MCWGGHTWTRGLPVLALCRVLIVDLYLLLRRLISDSCTFRRLAAARAAIPASSIPMALSLSSARNLGVVKKQ